METDSVYFYGDKLAYDVFNRKYSFNGETPMETERRIVNEIVRVESVYGKHIKRNKIRKLSKYGSMKAERYRTALKDGNLDAAIREDIEPLIFGFDKLLMGGSIISTIGTNQILSLSNCFVIKSPDDSLCGINGSINEMDNIFSRRGGVGLDLSTVRPKGSVINNAARISDGVVSLMKHKFAESTKYIAQNGRRGALMLMYDSRGIDLLDFITSKQDDVSITTANISVKMHDDFIRAAMNNEDYLLRFPVDLKLNDDDIERIMSDIEYNEVVNYTYNKKSVYFKKVKAKEIWDELVKCAWNKAEPGILFWDKIESYDPSSVYDNLKAVATNPCGEQPLAPYDTCRLLSFNLASLVKNPYTDSAYVDYDEVYRTFYNVQWIGDDIVDLECEYVSRIINTLQTKGGKPAEAIVDMWKNVISVAKSGRRTGVGYTGLGDYYAMLGLKYGDSDETERLFSTIFRALLDSSIDLSILRGSFESYSKKLEDAGNEWYAFVKGDFPDLYERMMKYGRRNVSLNTCAPAGTISLLAQCTSGIEPLFMPYYTRKVKVMSSGEPYDVIDQSGCKFKIYLVIHNGLKRWIKTRYPEVDIDALNEEAVSEYYKLSPYYGSCAQELDWKDRVRLQSQVQKYITSSISSTVNLDRSATIENIDGLFKLAHDSGCKGITIYRDGCREGVLASVSDKDKNDVKDTNNDAPKRPKSLSCNVIRFNNNSDKWIAFVGVYDNRPYEIFTGMLNKLSIPGNVEKGNIVRNKVDGNTVYDFEYFDATGSRHVIEGINRIFNKEFWNYGKLLSGLLRHKMPIGCVIKTLQGMTFDNETINSWRNGVVRSLKKWIKDGDDSGETCPDCGGKLVFENGCKRCKDCGYSACG